MIPKLTDHLLFHSCQSSWESTNGMSFITIHMQCDLNLGHLGGHGDGNRRHPELLVQYHLSCNLLVNVNSLWNADRFCLADNEFGHEATLLTDQLAEVGNVLSLVG